MYNETSGAMYEAQEEERKNDIRKKKIFRRRIISISILSIVLVYLIILLIDINRYKSGDTPLIMTNKIVKEYDDGTVTTYYSIGWVFREYRRETITDSEMVPIWSGIRMDNVLNRVNDPDLPQVETDYTVPSNEFKEPKVNGVLFFYNENEELLDTYKCLLSESDCEISKSAVYDMDKDHYQGIEMGIIDSRYVFITEYKNKATEAEEKNVFLYDIAAHKIIAKYQDVRYSIINKEKGYIDSSKYIIKKNDKWGIDEVVKGKINNVEDYTHEYLIYNSPNTYIMSDDNKEYYIFSSKDKTYTAKISEPIDKVYFNNDQIFVKTITKSAEITTTYYYKLFNSEGKNIVNNDTITYLEVYDNFVLYIENNLVKIIDYSANQLVKEEIPVYFTDYASSSSTNVSAIRLTTLNDTLIISTPKTRDRTHYTDEYYYNINTWEQTKVRRNVKETLS